MKKLSIAICWHMHQPVYKIEGTYLMPWARLHAVKDYLDMVLFLEKFPNLKLNFDIVPCLLDTIIDYSNGYNDIHSELTSKDTEELTEEEKSFIINNFFSSKFETMIYRSENYKTLFNKRFSNDNFSIDMFSQQEYSDLMALFNLVWIDPIHFERYPELEKLWNKQYNYTQQDRLDILNIQQQIIREIIPTYKKYINKGRIELTASAYYHSILPILIDQRRIKKGFSTTQNLPSSLGLVKDAKKQVAMSLDRIEEIFGVRPKGFWPPELCLSPASVELIAKEGIEWTISDEGILADSINIDFIKDFKGNLNDPYHILKVYEYQTKEQPISIIFRERSIPNLINFEYAGLDSTMAVRDLRDKIKIIQDKLLVSPDENHLLTIALDGENCWENYQNDGNDFLNKMYSFIEEDESLETVLVTDYIHNDKHKKPLTKIHSGSWIDQTFQYWIGESTKNKAWSYIKETKDILETYRKEFGETEEYKTAWQELLITEGSDWFWWYGEPNNSGQDFVFDYMFREHLINVYNILGVQIPDALHNSLITKVEMPFKFPVQNISPKMDGLYSSYNDWYYSGTLRLLDGPVYMENKNIDKIHYGCDSQNIYFRLHINKNSNDYNYIDRVNQFYLYLRNASTIKERAYIRLISKTDNPYPILKEKFEDELALTLIKDTLYPPRLATCLHQNMWTLSNPEQIIIAYKDVIDITIPFDSINVKQGEKVEFFIANTDSGVRNTNIPQEVLLSVTRG